MFDFEFNPKGSSLLDDQLAQSGLEMNVVGALIGAGASLIGGIVGSNEAQKQNEAAAAAQAAQQALLNKQAKLQNKYNMAYLFISHNLRLMKFFADRLLVMNKGSIVEEGSTLEIFKKPKSKYSKLLFEAAFNKNYN